MAGALLVAFSVASPGDELKLKSGDTVSGHITGFSDGQVAIASSTAAGGTAKLSYNLDSIQKIDMAAPDAVAALKDAPPATVVATLEPLIREYAGLPADWVVGAMGQLADAYDATGEPAKSEAIYAQINQLYPHSLYLDAAVSGTAKMQLQQGKIDEALATLQPLVTKAGQDLAPAPDEGKFYARAFLVYGQALEKKQQFPQALEAFLTVKTMFYQDPALAAEAESDAAALRRQNPGVSVD